MPTADNVADIFTKALDGAQFVKLRNLIMNVPESSADSECLDGLPAKSTMGGCERSGSEVAQGLQDSPGVL